MAIMQRRIHTPLFAAVLACLPLPLWANDSGITIEPTPRMKSVILTHANKLNAWVADPAVINAVKEQNTKNISLDEIKKTDQEWIAGNNQAFAISLQENAAGHYLKSKMASNKIYVEAFLCDKQGAVVGEYPKTTDYWQGDEDKFSQSFNHGDGKTYFGPLVLDESTKTYSVQISIPVKDGQDTIGVLIVGLINVN